VHTLRARLEASNDQSFGSPAYAHMSIEHDAVLNERRRIIKAGLPPYAGCTEEREERRAMHVDDLYLYTRPSSPARSDRSTTSVVTGKTTSRSLPLTLAPPPPPLLPLLPPKFVIDPGGLNIPSPLPSTPPPLSPPPPDSGAPRLGIDGLETCNLGLAGTDVLGEAWAEAY
jgi:hypothetical protein